MKSSVPYIGNYQPQSLGKKILLGVGVIGLSACAVLGAYSFYNQTKGSENLNQVQAVDQRVDYVLQELRANPEAFDRNYSKLADIVEQGFKANPIVTNRVVANGLESLTYQDIQNNTFKLMAKKVIMKAEEKPALMDSFGPKAKGYIEEKVSAKYIEAIEEAYQDTQSSIKATLLKIDQYADKALKPEWFKKNIDKPITDALFKIKKKIKDCMED